MRWIWLAAAAAAIWWLWRRHKAMSGKANTTGAPAGATPAGVAAALAAGTTQQTQRCCLSPKVTLHEVGFGLVAPMQVMNASKPPPPPATQPPKGNNPPNGCGPGKKPTKVTTGSTTRTECR